MNELTTQKTALLSEVVRATKLGTGKALATIATVAVMAPLLFIALLPISLLMLVLLPPVGLWMAAGTLFGSDSAL